MNELHLFAGAGGGILGAQLRGHRCVCAVERDPYAQAVLVARQNDGTFAPFPIWDDVRTFDGRPWHRVADVVAGGFPCQDISAAGGGAGLEGERSGLWSEMARIVCEVRPGFVYVENSPMLTSRGLGRVLGDLAEMGFDAQWGVVSAADVGAPHIRERIWILAHAHGLRELQQARRQCYERFGLGDGGEDVADTDSQPSNEGRQGDTSQGSGGRNADRGGVIPNVAHAMRQRQQRFVDWSLDAQERARQEQRPDRSRRYGDGRWPIEPGVGRVAHGVAHRSHRIRALGNGQVPRVEATAWQILTEPA